MVAQLRSLLQEIVAARATLHVRGDKLELKGRRIPEKLKQAVSGAQPLLQVYCYHLTWAEELIDEQERLLFSRRPEPTAQMRHQQVVEGPGELVLLRLAAASEGVWWQVLTLRGELLDEGGLS